ncbi:MAG: polysaccharide deacetylase family protein [candidate division WOR-3 bacterium]
MKGRRVLLYHNITDRDGFLWHLDFLSRFPSAHASGILEAPSPRVAISFDDGWTDLLWVFPELKARGLTATLFLTTTLPELRESGSWESFVCERFPRLSQKGPLVPLSWNELRDLLKDGLEIGSHGHRHIRFGQEAGEELRISKELIKENLGVDARIFAYPYGRRRDIELGARNLLPACGYEMAFIGHGWSVPDNCDPLLVPRHPIKDSWPITRLENILLGKADARERLSWWVQGLVRQF